MPHRKHPDAFYENLLRDLVAERGDVNAHEFAHAAGIDLGTVYRRFGSWGDLRRRVGLAPRTTRPHLRRVDPDRIRADLRRLAAQHGPEITLAVYTRHAGVSVRTIYNYFGTWNALRTLEGLPPNRTQRERITIADLVDDLQRLRTLLGRVPNSNDIQRHAKYSLSTYYARLGNMPFLRTILTPAKLRIWLAKQKARRLATQQHGTPPQPHPGRQGQRPPLRPVEQPPTEPAPEPAARPRS